MYPWDWRMLKWKADYSFLELHDLGCVWVSIPSGDFSLIKVREHQNCSPLRKQWNYPKRKIVQFFLKKKILFFTSLTFSHYTRFWDKIGGAVNHPYSIDFHWKWDDLGHQKRSVPRAVNAFSHQTSHLQIIRMA